MCRELSKSIMNDRAIIVNEFSIQIGRELHVAKIQPLGGPVLQIQSIGVEFYKTFNLKDQRNRRKKVFFTWCICLDLKCSIWHPFKVSARSKNVVRPCGQTEINIKGIKFEYHEIKCIQIGAIKKWKFHNDNNKCQQYSREIFQVFNPQRVVQIFSLIKCFDWSARFFL